MIKSSGLSERKGTPSNVLPDGDYLLEVIKCAAKEIVDEANGYVKGTNVSFQFVVEDVFQPANETRIGAPFFENVFLMSEEHPKYDMPLKNDPDGRTVGNLGQDQLTDMAKAMGVELDDEIEDENELFAGKQVIARIRQVTDKESGELTNKVRKWMKPKAEVEEVEEKPAAKAKARKR